jgi:hypothetical protein
MNSWIAASLHAETRMKAGAPFRHFTFNDDIVFGL